MIFPVCTTYLPSLVNIVCGRPLTCDLCAKSSFGVPFSICLKIKLVIYEPLLLGRDIEIRKWLAMSDSELFEMDKDVPYFVERSLRYKKRKNDFKDICKKL